MMRRADQQQTSTRVQQAHASYVQQQRCGCVAAVAAYGTGMAAVRLLAGNCLAAPDP